MQDQAPLDPDALLEQRPFVQALARRLVLDEHAADDLVQETLLAAIERPPRRSLRGFLARVVRNLAYKSLRAEERRRRRERRAARPDAQPPADDALARAVALRKVVDALVTLDEPYRTVLLLRYFEDLQPKEIAARLGRNPATVRSHLKRGLDRMRERLDAEHGGDRRAWCLALLPLAFASTPASAATAAVAAGVAAMTMKKKLVLAASLLVALLGTGYVARGVLRDGASTPERATPVADMEKPEDAPALETAAAEAPEPGVSFTVVVENLAGEPLEGADVVVRRARADSVMGVPVPDETALLRWIDQSRPLTSVLQHAVTDREGHAALSGQPGHTLDLLVRCEGYASHSARHWMTGLATARRLVVRLGPVRSLSGRVFDSDGNAIPGAIVLAGTAQEASYRGSGHWPARVVADATGRYELTDLPAEDLSLFAGYPGSVARYVAILRTPGPRRFDIRLGPDGTVEGRVTLEQKPVAGALVVVSDLRQRGSAVTDGAGHYRMEHVPEMHVSKIDVFKKGLAQVYRVVRRERLRVERGRTTRIDFEMVPGARIRGRVLGPDGPVPGASVGCSTRRADFGSLHRSVVADEEGLFVLDDLPPGRHVLRAYATSHAQPGFPDRWWEVVDTGADAPYLVDLEPGGEVERDVRLERNPVLVEGWVEGPDGEPFAGVWVGGGGGFTCSGPDGRFRLFMKPQKHDDTIGVHADGHMQVGAKPRISADTGDLHLKLRRAPSLLGTVRNEAGQAVPGSSVLYGRGTFPHNPETVKRAHFNRRWYDARRWPVRRDGSFEIDVLGSFDVYLRAEAPGYAPSAAVQLRATDLAAREEVALVLRASHRLAGKITCAGEPVAGAHVRLRGPTWTRPRYGSEDVTPAAAVVAVTSADGAFEAEVGAGTWTVVASAVGYADATTSTRVPGPEVHLELRRKLAIRGRLVFADGKPAAGVAIYRWQIDENGSTVPGQGTQYAHHTDARGRFVIRGLDPGVYKLNISSHGGTNVVKKTVEPVGAGTHDLRIVVERGRAITGRLVDAQGNALALVSVTARGEADSKVVSSDQTDANGYFEIDGLVPGTYTLRFRKQDEAQSEFKRRRVPAASRDVLIVWGEEDPLDAAARARAIGGVVVDHDGRPVEGASVRATNDEDRGASDRTDAEGRFLIELLEPGRYRMKVTAKRTVETGVFETGTLDARLVIPRGATVSGFVRDENGRPVENASVTAYVGREVRRARTGPKGAFEISGLPDAGDCVLRAAAGGFAVTLVEDVRIGRTGVVVVMRPGLGVSGTLQDAAGTPLPRVPVAVFHTENRLLSASTRTDAGGRFEIESRLSPGRYEVRASIAGKTRKCGTITAGAADVILVASK